MLLLAERVGARAGVRCDGVRQMGSGFAPDGVVFVPRHHIVPERAGGDADCLRGPPERVGVADGLQCEDVGREF